MKRPEGRCCDHPERWHNEDGVCLFGWPEDPCHCQGREAS